MAALAPLARTRRVGPPSHHLEVWRRDGSHDALSALTSASHGDTKLRVQWTGERCVPWADDLQVIYEHLNRYHMAAGLARGRRVLDLGSGEGYGAAILAQHARAVVGVDIDPPSVAHARERYEAGNLAFREGSALALMDDPDDTYELVVCFEMIEHVEDHDRLLNEVERVLAPGGVLLLSTPDRTIYSDEAGADNPFHVKELARAELHEALAARFPHLRLWGQRSVVGAQMQVLEPPAVDEGRSERTLVRREGREWVECDEPAPMYLVAAASHGPLPTLPDRVELLDGRLALLQEARERAQAAAGERDDLTERLREQEQAGQELGARFGAAARHQRGLAEGVRARDRQLGAARAHIARLERQREDAARRHAGSGRASAERERAVAARVVALTAALAERDRVVRETTRLLEDERRSGARARVGLLEGVRARERQLETARARIRELLRELGHARAEVAEHKRRARVAAREQASAGRRETALKDALMREELLVAEVARLGATATEARATAEGWEQGFHFVMGSRVWRAAEAVRRAGRLVGVRRRQSPPVPEALAAVLAVPPGGAGVQPDAPRALEIAVGGDDIRLRPSPSPRVSIVIAAHNQAALTHRCLRALAANTDHEVIETIVVDDASSDETSGLLGRASGIVRVPNGENLGFLLSCEKGAAVARGDHLLFLNNDTEVQPGWLDALLGAVQEEGVGAAGAKLVYPDGTLQEAGCVIWCDGSAWNIGRGGDPADPEYNFRREVDYCSAACLIVRRDAFDQVGGFDDRFAPAYYEDADLCLALRHAGWRVVYEPRACVMHHEGASHGTEERDGNHAHSKSSQRVNRHLFAAKWSEALSGHWPPGTATGRRGGRIDGGLRVLVIDSRVPMHDRDAGSLRMYWMHRLLRGLGCHVTLFPTNRAAPEPYTAELQALGVEVHHGPWSLGALAQERAGLYDLVLLSRPEVAEECLDIIRAGFPSALVVYDSVDLHFLREARRLALNGHRPGAAQMRERELACVRRSDLAVTVTHDEATVLMSHVPGLRTLVVPTIHEVDEHAGAPYEERRDLLFIAGFQHPPNVDGILWFADSILPLVRRRLDARLIVVGAGPPEGVTGLACDDIVVTGYQPSVDEYFRGARVFVSPLRYGAGMKGKNGQAMSYGLPMVTTPIGAEGMDLTHRRTAMIATDPQEFADAIVQLYEDRALWEAMSRGAREHARARWSPEVVRAQLRHLLNFSRPSRSNGAVLGAGRGGHPPRHHYDLLVSSEGESPVPS